MESHTNTLFEIAEIELSYKSKVQPSLRPKITSSHEAYEVLKDNWDHSKIEFIEQFQILLMNRANRVLGIYRASSGTTTGCVVDPKSVFVAALKANACAVILAHNHPSGNLTPSQADIDLTKKLVEAGKFLEIQVVDHVILTTESYYSFADEGRL
jgi:DNA repair protein RadC